MNKMTDEQIKKALKVCAKNETPFCCGECELGKNNSSCDCVDRLLKLSLDLINRQQSAIDVYMQENDRLKTTYIQVSMDRDETKTENERLNNELHSKVEYIHELLEIIENKKTQIKRYEDLKKAENILDLLEQDAFKRSIYNTIDTIKRLENEIEELQKMVGK